MNSRDIQDIVNAINEIAPVHQVGGMLGVTGFDVDHNYIVSNKDSVKDSHYSCKINTYNDAVEILNELISSEYIDEVLIQLNDESNYDEEKQLYFHYLKSIKI